MKVTLKVKHLMMIGIVVFGIVPLVLFPLREQLPFIGAAGDDEGNPATLEKKQILEKLESPTTSDRKRWEIIQKEMIYGLNRYDVYAGPGFSQVNPGPASMKFSWEERVPFLQEYVKAGPVDGYLKSAAVELANYHERNGRFAKAEQVLVDAMNRYETYNFHKQELVLHRAELVMYIGDKGKQEQLLEEAKKDMIGYDLPINDKLIDLETRYMLSQNNQEDAIEKTSRKIAVLKRKQDDGGLTHAEEKELTFLESLIRNIDHLFGEENRTFTTLKGKVERSDGKPVAGAEIILRPKSSVYMSPSEEDKLRAMTGADGSYEISGVPKGSYQPVLGLTFDQVDGWTWPVDTNEWIDTGDEKVMHYSVTLRPLLNIQAPSNYEEITQNEVTFEWEKVKGAAYYDLSFGMESTGGSRPMFQRVKENKLTVPVEELYAKDFPAGMTNERFESEALLGFANPNAAISWYVTAYDENGDVLTRSNGYRLKKESMGNLPFFHMKTRTLTEADKLLLDNKVEEALQQYKRTYEEKDDLHSLRMIIRIMDAAGWYDLFESGSEKADVIPYLTELVKREPTENGLFQLVMDAYEKRDWASFEKRFKEYKDYLNGSLNEYVRSIYANAQLKQGKGKEAITLYAGVVPEDTSHRFVGNWIAAEIMTSGSLTEAIKIAGQYPERGGNAPDWEQILLELQQALEKKSELEKALRNVLVHYIELPKKEFIEWKESVKDSHLKQLADALAEIG